MRKSYEDATGYCTSWNKDEPEKGVTLAFVRHRQDTKGDRILEPLARFRMDREKMEALVNTLQERLRDMKSAAE